MVEGERQRPEDEHEQHDDEDQRQVLHLVAGVAGRLLLVHLNGDAARQVDPQPGGQPGIGDLRPHAVDEVLLIVLVAAVVGREGQQLHGLAVGRAAHVEHLLDPGHGVELGLQGIHGADVRRGQRPAGGRRDDRDREQVRAAERRGQVDRVLAGRARGQELGVVALGHARQRRQLRHGRDRAENPDQQDQPAKADGPPADGTENRIDVHGQRAYCPPPTTRCATLRPDSLILGPLSQRNRESGWSSAAVAGPRILSCRRDRGRRPKRAVTLSGCRASPAASRPGPACRPAASRSPASAAPGPRQAPR